MLWLSTAERIAAGVKSNDAGGGEERWSEAGRDGAGAGCDGPSRAQHGRYRGTAVGGSVKHGPRRGAGPELASAARADAQYPACTVIKVAHR